MDANSRRLGRSPNVLARPPGEVRTQRSVLPCRVACSSKPSSVATMRAVRTAEGVTQCTRRLRLVAGRKGIEGRRMLELLKGEGWVRWVGGRGWREGGCWNSLRGRGGFGGLQAGPARFIDETHDNGQASKLRVVVGRAMDQPLCQGLFKPVGVLHCE